MYVLNVGCMCILYVCVYVCVCMYGYRLPWICLYQVNQSGNFNRQEFLNVHIVCTFSCVIANNVAKHCDSEHDSYTVLGDFNL